MDIWIAEFCYYDDYSLIGLFLKEEDAITVMNKLHPEWIEPKRDSDLGYSVYKIHIYSSAEEYFKANT